MSSPEGKDFDAEKEQKPLPSRTGGTAGGGDFQDDEFSDPEDVPLNMPPTAPSSPGAKKRAAAAKKAAGIDDEVLDLEQFRLITPDSADVRREEMQQRADMMAAKDTPLNLTVGPAKKKKREQTSADARRRLLTVPRDDYHFRVIAIDKEIKDVKLTDKMFRGDDKVYREMAKKQLAENKLKIKLMREANSNLRTQVAAIARGDAELVKAAFTKTDRDLPPRFKGMPSQRAKRDLDRSINTAQGQLNAVRYRKSQLQKRMDSLDTLQKEYQQQHLCVVSLESGETMDAQKLRALANGVEHFGLRLDEGRTINKLYHKILERYQEDRLHFDRLFKAMAAAIETKSKAYDEIVAVNEATAETADAVKKYAMGKEERTQEDKDKVEAILSKYQEVVDDYREQYESRERKKGKASLTSKVETVAAPKMRRGDDVDGLVPQVSVKRIELMEKIGMLGNYAPEELAKAYMEGRGTAASLRTLAERSKLSVRGLEDTKKNLLAAFEKLKFSQAAKLSSGQKMLEEVRKKIVVVKAENKILEVEAIEGRAKVEEVINGILYLSQKLGNVKEPGKPVRLIYALPPTREELAVERLRSCEAKMCGLATHLKAHEKAIRDGTMEEVELLSSMVDKIPKFHIRVTLKDEVTAEERLKQNEKRREVDRKDTSNNNTILTHKELKDEANRRLGKNKKKKKSKEPKKDRYSYN